MKLHHLLVLASMAGILIQPAVAANHGRPAARPVSVSTAPTMCPMFESRYWDNQGFVVACDKRAQNVEPAARRCAMFDSSAYDTVGFTVSCGKEAVAAWTPPRTCPMFTPSTWDNMGFRVLC